jgi:hypothetical protein
MRISILLNPVMTKKDVSNLHSSLDSGQYNLKPCSPRLQILLLTPTSIFRYRLQQKVTTRTILQSSHVRLQPVRRDHTDSYWVAIGLEPESELVLFMIMSNNLIKTDNTDKEYYYQSIGFDRENNSDEVRVEEQPTIYLRARSKRQMSRNLCSDVKAFFFKLHKHFFY